MRDGGGRRAVCQAGAPRIDDEKKIKIKKERAGRKSRNIPRWLRRRVGTNPLTTAALFWAHIHLLIAFPCACRTPPISSASYLRHSRLPLSPPFSPSPPPFSHFFRLSPLPSHARRYCSRSATTRGGSRPSPWLLESFHSCRSGTFRHHPSSELRNFAPT